MGFQSLTDFLEQLAELDELKRIDVEVDPRLELAAITNQVCKQAGPALLFTNVSGFSTPIVTNVLGTKKRIEIALGLESLDQLESRVRESLQPKQKQSWLGQIPSFSNLLSTSHETLKSVNSAGCQQVVHLGTDFSLLRLPSFQHWPSEAEHGFHSALVFTKHPVTEELHLGLMSGEILSENKLAFAWPWQHECTEDYLEYRKLKQPMPVAVVFGANPLLPLLANIPLMSGMNRFELFRFLMDGPLETVHGRTIDLQLPAHAEMILEGTVSFDVEEITLRPQALPSGYYSVKESSFPCSISAITSQTNPVYPAIIHGNPQQELSVHSQLSEKLFLPILQSTLPELVDLHVPRFGKYHNFAFVSFRKYLTSHAQKIAHAFWGLSPFWYSKFLVLLDESVDVRSMDEVFSQVGLNVDPERDFYIHAGPLDVFDHTSPDPMLGAKVAIDATAKKQAQRIWPEKLQLDQELQQKILDRWSEYGLDA